MIDCAENPKSSEGIICHMSESRATQWESEIKKTYFTAASFVRVVTDVKLSYWGSCLKDNKLVSSVFKTSNSLFFPSC